MFSMGCLAQWAWGGQLLDKVRRCTLTYADVTEGVSMCASEETHQRVKSELYNRRQPLSESDVAAAAAQAAAGTSSLPAAVLWAVLSLVTVELAVRELLIWLFNCTAFATRQQVRVCVAGAHSIRPEWEGIVLVLALGVCLCLQCFCLCWAWQQRAASVVRSSSGFMSYIYQKALSTPHWLDGSLAVEAPHLWGGRMGPDAQRREKAQLLSDMLMHDVGLIAQAESYTALSRVSLALIFAATGLIFREVELSGVGGVIAVVVLMISIVGLLVSPDSARTLDGLRSKRLVDAVRQLVDLAALKLLMWHQGVASRFGPATLDAAFDFDLAAVTNVVISDSVVAALITSATGWCMALVVVFEMFVFKEDKGMMTSFELYMVLSLAALLVTPLLIVVQARRHATHSLCAKQRVLQFLALNDEIAPGCGAVKPPQTGSKQQETSEFAIKVEKCVFEWGKEGGWAKPGTARYALGEDSDSLSLHVRKVCCVFVFWARLAFAANEPRCSAGVAWHHVDGERGKTLNTTWPTL